MILNKYAFLVKDSSYSSKEQNVFLKTDEFSTEIIGVSGVKEAIITINNLINKDIQLVELCGGFTQEEKKEIKTKIKKDIPIGLVELAKEDIELLEMELKR